MANTGGTQTNEASLSGAMNTLSISADDLKDVLPLLVPPTDQEAERYYGTFPSHPRLIGRTSSGIDPWIIHLTNPGEPFSVYQHRVMSPISQHPIRKTWKTIRWRVIAAINRLPWTSVDIWRIGKKNNRPQKRPVVVWVGIDSSQAASVPWDDVALTLRECRVILDAAGLMDVECELRSSDVFSLAGEKSGPEPVADPAPKPAPEPAPRPRLLSPNDYVVLFDNLFMMPLTSAVGQSLFVTHDEDTFGTLCVYLRSTSTDKNDTKKIWALTCRHLVLPEASHPENELHKHTGAIDQQGQPPPLAIAAPRTNDVTGIIWHLHCQQENIARKRRQSASDDMQDDSRESMHRYELEQNAEARKTVQSFRSVVDRIIGRVALSPPTGTFTAGPNTWARDWALVELDTDAKFPANLVNELGLARCQDPIGSLVKLDWLVNPTENSKRTKNTKKVVPTSGFLRLSGTIPALDMRHHLATVDKNGDERPLVVLMRGATSGITRGCPSELFSTVRYRLPDGRFIVSTEWAVKGSSRC